MRAIKILAVAIVVFVGTLLAMFALMLAMAGMGQGFA